jgi:hypothetical protein
VPEKADQERDDVAAAWAEAGGAVTRLARFWDPPALERHVVRIYGNDTFALVLAQVLGLSLVSPPDDLPVRLPAQWVKRAIRVSSLSQADSLPYPIFVKPLTPKLFRAAIYKSGSDLLAECSGLELTTEILVSEAVHFVAEARSFVLSGTVQDIALYEGNAPLDQARDLAGEIGRSELLPATCVIDLGLIPERGWAVIEANATWGAGLNGCNARRVVPCIAAATRFGSERTTPATAPE